MLQVQASDMFGPKLKNHNDELYPIPMALMGNYIGIFFAAHYNPECVTFTPKLIAAFHEINERPGTTGCAL